MLAATGSVLAAAATQHQPAQAKPKPAVSDPAPATALPVTGGIAYTPNEHFFVQQIGNVPRIDASDWLLTCDGLVDHVHAWDYTTLAGMALHSVDWTLSCGGNPNSGVLLGHASWAGIPLSDLLADMQWSPAVHYLNFGSVDGYTTSLSIDQLPDALLALYMNGERLSPEHGFPIRLIVPGLYGYKMPKWIHRITLADQPVTSFWEQRGWSQQGRVNPTVAIHSPHHKQTTAAKVALSGVAYATPQVALSADDGPWMPIAVEYPDAGQWGTWQTVWTAPAPGEYVIRAKTTDAINGEQNAHAIIVHVADE